MKNFFFLIFATVLCSCGASHIPLGAPVGASAPNVAPDTYSHHKTFQYVEKRQAFKVPAGITQLSVVAIGGAGFGGVLGYGGRVSAVLPVTAGTLLYVRVGGNGVSGGDIPNGGYNGGGDSGRHGKQFSGGGGGGASDIRQDGDALSDRIVVAGGGGGEGAFDGKCCGLGGKGGNATGGDGGAGWDGYSGSSGQCGGIAGCGGFGGTQKAGGSGGFGGDGADCAGGSGGSGSLGKGGNGSSRQVGPKTTSGGVFCYGGLGGGGGGGYYGGGGGGSDGANAPYYGGGGGGGGGSSYVESSATNVHMWQGWNKNQSGLIVLSW